MVSKGNPKDSLDIPLLSPVRSLIVPDGGRSAGSINKVLQAINPTQGPSDSQKQDWGGYSFTNMNSKVFKQVLNLKRYKSSPCDHSGSHFNVSRKVTKARHI